MRFTLLHPTIESPSHCSPQSYLVNLICKSKSDQLKPKPCHVTSNHVVKLPPLTTIFTVLAQKPTTHNPGNKPYVFKSKMYSAKTIPGYPLLLLLKRQERRGRNVNSLITLVGLGILLWYAFLLCISATVALLLRFSSGPLPLSPYLCISLPHTCP